MLQQVDGSRFEPWPLLQGRWNVFGEAFFVDLPTTQASSHLDTVLSDFELYLRQVDYLSLLGRDQLRVF